MTNLELFNQKTMSSREISELTGKRHDHVLRDCDVLNEYYKKMSLPTSGEGSDFINTEEYHRGDRTQYKYLKSDTFEKINSEFNKNKFPLIIDGYYLHPKTGNQQHREYLLTRMQTFDLMTGYNVELRIKVNRRWEELETKQVSIESISRKEIAKMLLEAEEEKEKLQLENRQNELALEEAKPKVAFAESFKASSSIILIRDLAKYINQNICPMGEARLYDWMVSNKYLIRSKRWSNTKKKYINDYMPTQRASDLKVFHVIPIIIQANNCDVFTKHIVKVNSKGQTYFINKFLKEKKEAI